MVYRNVECPHCGNDISVKNIQEDQKCKWCRRLVKAKFTRRKNGRFIVEVEPVEFKINQGTPFTRHSPRFKTEGK